MYVKAIVWADEIVPVSAWLPVSICHFSPVAPVIGSATLQEAPLSNQYPVAVVVRTCPNEEPSWVAVKVGGIGDPPPLTE